jgi:hypothetical protein
MVGAAAAGPTDNRSASAIARSAPRRSSLKRSLHGESRAAGEGDVGGAGVTSLAALRSRRARLRLHHARPADSPLREEPAGRAVVVRIFLSWDLVTRTTRVDLEVVPVDRVERTST